MSLLCLCWMPNDSTEHFSLLLTVVDQLRLVVFNCVTTASPYTKTPSVNSCIILKPGQKNNTMLQNKIKSDNFDKYSKNKWTHL